MAPLILLLSASGYLTIVREPLSRFYAGYDEMVARKIQDMEKLHRTATQVLPARFIHVLENIATYRPEHTPINTCDWGY